MDIRAIYLVYFQWSRGFFILFWRGSSTDTLGELIGGRYIALGKVWIYRREDHERRSQPVHLIRVRLRFNEVSRVSLMVYNLTHARIMQIGLSSEREALYV